MHGRGTAFIFKSMSSARNPLSVPNRLYSSYDPLEGFEPWNPASPTSPINPMNQAIMFPEESTATPSRPIKIKNKPAPTPVIEEEQQPYDWMKLMADY